MYSDEDRIRIGHQEAGRLEQFLTPLSPEDWRWPSACDAWTVADAVAHLAGMGHNFAGNIQRGLAGDTSPPEGFSPSGTLNEDEFREGIARRAIAQRESLGDALLSALVEGNEKLDQVLTGMEPQDWDTPRYHTMGLEPVRTLIDMRITETAMHWWDIRSSFDPLALLHPDPLTALTNTIPRAVRRAFRPDASRTRPVCYRFQLTGPVAATTDVVLTGKWARFEPSSQGQGDLTFRCETFVYVMAMFGRLKVDAAIDNGSISAKGDQRLISAFVQAFVGG